MEVRIAELEARLREVLGHLRRGDDVIVLDRDRPIARLVPYDAGDRWVVREPRAEGPAPGEVELPHPRKLRTDVLQLLLEERQSHR
jgi:antitoxin (DNA-binding transcriptional repressor) of toxin-antitoxin stability system